MSFEPIDCYGKVMTRGAGKIALSFSFERNLVNFCINNKRQKYLEKAKV